VSFSIYATIKVQYLTCQLALGGKLPKEGLIQSHLLCQQRNIIIIIFLTSRLASFIFFILMKGMVSNEVSSLEELGNLHTRVGVQIYLSFKKTKGQASQVMINNNNNKLAFECRSLVLNKKRNLLLLLLRTNLCAWTEQRPSSFLHVNTYRVAHHHYTFHTFIFNNL
jgi:hypothetical protein